MLSIASKNKIVNSYSLVLIDILKKSGDANGEILKLQEIINGLGDLLQFNVNPIKIKEYKNAVKNILKSLDKDNDVENFLKIILERKYLFLLSDIIELTKSRIQKEFNKKNLVIFSNDELNIDIKNSIIDIIKKQIKDADVVFKIKKTVAKDTIDFISNGNICTIDLKQLLNGFFVCQ